MGFGDLLGDAFDAVGDAAGNGLGLATDLAKTFTSIENGSIYGEIGKRAVTDPQVRESAAKAKDTFFRQHKSIAAIAKPIAAVNGPIFAAGGAALNYPLDKVKRGMSTWEILNSEEVAGPATGLGVGQLFDAGKWKQSWMLSDNVTPGQALLRRSGQTPLGKAAGLDEKLGIDGSTWQNIHAYGDQNSDKFSPAFSFASGTFDAAVSWSKADPLVAAGAGAKALHAAHTEVRAGDVAALSADKATLKGRQAKVRNQFDAFITDTDDKSAAELMKHAAFADSTQGAALASLFAKASGDHETKRLLWRTAMGDEAAKTELVGRRADLSFQIDRLTGDLDHLLAPRSSTVGYGLRTPGSAPDLDQINAIKAEIESSKPMMDMLNRALGDDESILLADDLGTLVNKDEAGVLGSVSNRTRVTRADRRRASKMSSYTVQDGVAGIPVRVLRSPTQRRPEGWIDLHDAEQGFSEIDRMSQRVRGLDPAVRQDWLNRFLNAPDDNARRLVVQHVEQAAVNHIGASLGYTPGEVKSILNKVQFERDAVIAQLREKAYGVLEDGTVVRSPLMETQLANSAPTLDVDHIYRVLKRNQDTSAAMRAGHQAFDTSEALLDIMNDAWKTSVLLRGGYVLRNIMDSQLRLIAHLGGLHAMTLQAENAGASIGRRLGKGDGFAVGVRQDGPYEYADAMGRNADSAKLIRKGNSSADGWASIAVGESEKILNHLRASGSWETITANEANAGQWSEAYLRVVNQHLRQSEITKRLLSGESPADVERWLKSPEGRALRRRLVHYDTPAELVEANAQNLRHLVPEEMWGTLNERALTHDDIESMFTTVGSRPAVNAEQVLWSMGQGKAAELYHVVRDKWFHYANGLPDDVLGRHPMYVSLYRGRMRQLLRQSDPALEGTISKADQVVLETQARTFAKRQMKRYMFDVAGKSNLGHFVRFLSPFYSAWEDVVVKYGRMIAEDPALVPQSWKVWTAPNNASFIEVVDSQTGEPVPAGESRLNDNEAIRLPAGFLEKYFSLGGADISKASFNVVLQGDPVWAPGFGPMAQAPVNELALHLDNPKFSDVVQQLGVLPYGVQNQNARNFFYPTALRNVTMPEDRAVRMKAMIAVTEEARYREGKRDTRPTPAEINRRYKATVALRTFTALTSPVSVQFKSPYQFYIDQSHAYDAKYGNKADEKFYADFGEDLYLFRASMSNNRTGIMATQRADSAARKVKDLIEKYPSFGWYFVGPDNKGDYDRNVYTAQSARKVNPLTSDTWRDTYSNPVDAIAKNNAEVGWIEYQKLTARLEAIRISRGLPNMQVKGAADLRAAKKAWMESLTGDKAPDWGHDWLNDYEARDAGSTRKFLEAARTATQDDRLKDRPDIATMTEYLKYRDAIRGVLRARYKAGGSGTLAGNDDVEAAWQAITGYLVDKDVTFADTFARYLERDDLSAKA